MENDNNSAAQALGQIIELLSRLDDESRARVFRSISAFFHLENIEPARSLLTPNEVMAGAPTTHQPFSEEQVPAAKQFIFDKDPQTDVERVACLAYYLTHYRDTPHFKTIDIAKLNTEAAQPKFSNTAYSCNNAANAGYLAPASNNLRQLSAAGEKFVMTLPDRIAAKEAMNAARRRSRK